MSPSEALSTCTSPVQTARVFNPTRPEYYLADEAKTAVAQKTEPAVIVTLSDQAKVALKA